MRRLYHWVLVVVLAAAVCLPLAFFSNAAAEDGFVMQVPVADSMEELRKNKRLDLLEFSGEEYTLSFRRMDDDGLRWVRLVIARGDTFYGTITLGTWEQLQDLGSLRIEADFQPNRAEFEVTSLPDNSRRGSIALPMSLGGVPLLSEDSEAMEIALEPRVTEEEQAAAEEEEAAAAAQQEEPPAPKREKVGAGPYAAALILLVLVLAALVLGQMFGRKWRLALRDRTQMLMVLLKGLRARKRLPEEQAAALPPSQPKNEFTSDSEYDSTQILMNSSELPRMEPSGVERDDSQKSAFAGITVMPAPAQNSLLRRILMREEAEAELPSQEEQEKLMQEFFVGHARLPRYRFLTVGLNNRDTLQQLGSESVRPLFAPNPRGQLFSIEEESGNLYLHVEYFAPPSFVMQSVLRSVCLDRMFDCVDGNGGPVVPEDAVNHAIASIVPAKTTRTEAGFILTEKGTLVVGKS